MSVTKIGNVYIHTDCAQRPAPQYKPDGHNPLGGESLMVYVYPNSYRCENCGHTAEASEVEGEKNVIG